MLTGSSPVRRQLKKDVVPSVFAWQKQATASEISRSKRVDSKLAQAKEQEKTKEAEDLKQLTEVK